MRDIVSATCFLFFFISDDSTSTSRRHNWQVDYGDDGDLGTNENHQSRNYSTFFIYLVSFPGQE